jgi:hypothetical protein
MSGNPTLQRFRNASRLGGDLITVVGRRVSGGGYDGLYTKIPSQFLGTTTIKRTANLLA